MTTDTTSIITSTIDDRKDYYTALYQAALTITSSLEIEQVLQSVVKSTAEAMQVKACGLRLFHPDTGQLQLAAVYGLSSDYLAKGSVAIGQSPIDRETLGGKSVFVEDARIDSRFHYRDAAKQEGIVSVLSVPLEVHGSAIGVMRVYTDKVTIFEESDIQFLSVLASLAALAIDNAHLYENLKNSFNSVMDALWGVNVSL
ncbi:MAG: GAF domain-containing protein [Ktedonobacteraceae bacterium]|nr:GAF domain-containing protein [Ktedonobacteraceae bacterium]